MTLARPCIQRLLGYRVGRLDAVGECRRQCKSRMVNAEDYEAVACQMLHQKCVLARVTAEEAMGEDDDGMLRVPYRGLKSGVGRGSAKEGEEEGWGANL